MEGRRPTARRRAAACCTRARLRASSAAAIWARSRVEAGKGARLHSEGRQEGAAGGGDARCRDALLVPRKVEKGGGGRRKKGKEEKKKREKEKRKKEKKRERAGSDAHVKRGKETERWDGDWYRCRNGESPGKISGHREFGQKKI